MEQNLTDILRTYETFTAALWDQTLTQRQREHLCIRAGWDWDGINRISTTTFSELSMTALHELARVAFYQ